MHTLFNERVFVFGMLDAQGAAAILRVSVDPYRVLQPHRGKMLAPALVRSGDSVWQAQT